MALGENPTGVNSFTGTSDESKTAQVAQGLWDRLEAAEKGLPDPSPVANPQAPEPAASPEVAAPEAQAPEASSSEEAAYSDFDDFVSKNQYDRESLLALPVKLKVDGRDETVPLKELIDAGQLRRHAQLETQKSSQAQKAWEAERAAAQQALGAQWQQTQQLAQLARQQLFSDRQNTDWSKYSAEDQLALERNFNQRDAQIQHQLAQMQAAQQQSQAKILETERAKMLEALPEWNEPEKFSAAKSAISTYATQRGFTPAELSGVLDHRYMLVLADAAKARDLQAQVDTLKAQLAGKTDVALKKVRAAPQIVSSGARQVRDPKGVALDASKQSFLKNSRNPEAQAAYAEALLSAGA